jgi:hypothetical protein
MCIAVTWCRRVSVAEIRLQEGESLENALRRFKRKVQSEDIIREVKTMDGPKTQYWGVSCSVCRIMIPLATIAFTPERKVIPYRSNPALFMADCANGHTAGTYSKLK